MVAADRRRQAGRMTTTTPTSFPGQQVPPPAGRPPLQRSATGKLLGGVCSGLAAHTGIDVLLWRVGAVLLTLTGPGVLVYLALWVLMPMGPTGPDYAPNLLDTWVERLRGALSGKQSPPPVA
jgi:phage shock protein C